MIETINSSIHTKISVSAFVGREKRNESRTPKKMKAFVLFIIATIFLLFSEQAKAQSSRDSESSTPEKESSLRSLKKKKIPKRVYKNYDQGIKDYEKLMKENKKKYAKIQKGMKKPQYSDLSYFGHKKRPKKRPLEKRKFCKECGIVH